MKLTAILLLSACLAASAKGYSQQITLARQNAPLVSVFADIEKQSGYHFLFTYELVEKAGNVDIHVANATLRQTLDKLLAGKQLAYSIVEKTIVIKPMAKNPNDETGIPYEPSPITGRVLDSLGNPLSGATITNKNTRKSVSSAADGSFGLNVTEGDVLVFSFVGYETQEVTITSALIDKARLSPSAFAMLITLKTKITEEEEAIVNTGIQRVKANQVTGAVVLLNNAQLNRVVSTDILSRLQNASGVLFNHFTNDVQNRSEIVVRGYSTIFSRKDPLIVLDDFPYEGDINSINPNDIQDIAILKDAAATSIWGTRAANGVIVISTKAGRYNQKPQISFTNNFSIISKPDLAYSPILNSSDFIDLETFLFNSGNYTSQIGSTLMPALSPVVEILLKRQNGLISPADSAAQINRLRGMDIRKDILKYYYGNLFREQLSTSLSGGGINQKYFLSLGADYNKQNFNNYKRISIVGGNTYSFFNRRLEVTTRLSYARTNSQNFPIPLGIAYPYARLADENGNPAAIARYRQGYIDTVGGGRLLDWRYFPLEEKRNAKNASTGNNFSANAGIAFKVTNSLNAELKYQYLTQTLTQENYNGLSSFFARDLINQYTDLSQTAPTLRNPVPVGGIFDRNTIELISQNVRGQLNYNTSLKGIHAITALVGTELTSAKTRSNSSRYYGYNENGTHTNVDYVNAYRKLDGSSTAIPNPQAYTGLFDRMVSFYSNASYTYKNRYTVYLSGRKDGNNIFGTNSNNKWKPLWSVGGSWSVNNEKFYNIEWLPYLKLRTTYGRQGNANNSIAALLTLTYVSANKYGFTSANILNPPNPDLRWENIGQMNMGLDFATKNQRISGSFDFYYKKGIDIIGVAFLPPSSGLSSTQNNSADVKGKGIDLTLKFRNTVGKVEILSDFIFSYAKDWVYRYKSNLNSIVGYVQGDLTVSPIIGKPISAIYSYRWAGLNPNNGNPQGYLNGIKSEDYDKVIRSSDFNDLVYNGPRTAPYFGSFLNTVNYMNFSLSANIMYKMGYYFRRNSIDYGSLFSGANLGNNDYLRRWQNPGDELNTNVPSLIYPNPQNSDRDLFYRYSEALIEKGDHVKLNDIRMSYTVRPRSKNIFNSMELSVYASNLQLFLWRANKYKLDPDVIPTNNDFLYGLPGAVFSFGLKASF